MLTRSFIHLPGVGPRRELAIWRAGVADWAGFLERGRDLLPRAVYERGRPVVEASLAALERPGGLSELAGLFPPAEHWRFHPHFRRIVALDIETGGAADDWGGVTVVGLYDGQRVEQYVADSNMWLLNDAMKGYDVVLTFAGSTFDLPVLRQVFPNLFVPPIHIDLRWLLARLGLKGGLKRIERLLGISRPPEVAGLGGYDALLLWQRHLAGEPGALDALLAYNAQDVVNLPPLLEWGVGRLRERLLGRLG
ncbi:MAG: ribonuclease H-like domain-containing protein [Thermodesulfobacteriota bacterium]